MEHANPADPASVYRQRIGAYDAALRRLAKFDLSLGFGKLLLLAAAVYLLIRAVTASRPLLPFGLALGLFAAAAAAHGVVLRRKRRLASLKEIQETEIRSLAHEFLEVDDGREADEPGHPYSADLELFGPRSVFHFINRTATRMGRDRLAALFKGQGETPERKVILSRQDAVRELAPALDFRHELRLHGFGLGDSARHIGGLSEFLKEPAWILTRPVLKAAIVVFPLIALLAAAGLFFGLPRWVFYLSLLLNGLTVLAGEKRVARTYRLMSRTHDVLKSYARILADIERADFRSDWLRELQSRLFSDGLSASGGIGKLSSLLGLLEFRTGQIVYVAVNVLILWDLHCLWRIEKWRRDTADRVPAWFETIAEIDALSSLANASFNNPGWAFPEITGTGIALEMEAAGNPLIPEGVRVDNDLRFGTAPRIAVVTGPNMAGKSTFLKTVGVNLVLAYAGGPVCARRMTVSPSLLMTSMKVNDSLDRGLSLFHAELQRLKDILDPVREGKSVFFLIDEMLKGTNAADRQVGSLALLRQLARRGVSGLVATHDLHLTNLAGEFPDKVLNFHFDGRVEGDRLVFDFLLRPGRCESFNALALMKIMGIDV
jgi:hypothetical protein